MPRRFVQRRSRNRGRLHSQLDLQRWGVLKEIRYPLLSFMIKDWRNNGRTEWEKGLLFNNNETETRKIHFLVLYHLYSRTFPFFFRSLAISFTMPAVVLAIVPSDLITLKVTVVAPRALGRFLRWVFTLASSPNCSCATVRREVQRTAAARMKVHSFRSFIVCLTRVNSMWNKKNKKVVRREVVISDHARRTT